MSDHTPGTCACCAGTAAETPARVDNPAGQRAIVYRAGTHASFKASLLARLSDAELPALAGLGARDDDDFTIALCDALATTLDVLTFYQERIANENFLRTATERRSVLELARLIGYELAPGVAASTYLAFTLQEVPGSPALAPAPVELPVGTRVQSVPGPGEQAQTFETVEVAEARVEWNAIPVQASIPWRPQLGDRELYLSGVANSLQAGDVVLIVGEERLDDTGSERWDIRLLTEVEVDASRQITRLAWGEGLGHVTPTVHPAASGVVVYAFRQRAGLFGHNAPDPRLMKVDEQPLKSLISGANSSVRWKDSMFRIQGSQIDLDAAYPKITPRSWFALVTNGPGRDPSGLQGYVELYGVKSVSSPSRVDFGLTGKITRLEPDTTENLDAFRTRIRQALVLAQSEPVPVAETPLDFPLYGETLGVGRTVESIDPGRALAVIGKRARIRLRRGRPDVTLNLVGGGTSILKEGDSARLASAPERQSGGAWVVLPPEQFGERVANRSGILLRLRLLDRDGREGVCTLAAAAIEMYPALEDDEEVQEIAFVANLPTAVQDRAFVLSAALRLCYDRPTARVNANVAPATHGETVKEVLGSGDARQPNQGFPLRQSPLTFVSAATPSGRRSTLELRANDLRWEEVPSLFEREPTERVYELTIDDQARATARFGDGVEGARLPSGDHNIRATYRKGLGLAGNVKAGSLTTLLSRPLGVNGVSNPSPATGGEDPETQDRARDNAPLTVLTLDRAVSIRDYQDFARAFAGIARAHALWIPSGPARGVFLTVAGEEGAAVPEGTDTFRNLQDALHRYGDPLMPLRLVSYRAAKFRVRLSVKVADDADATLVLPAVEARLREAFGFAARRFGQGVSVDEVSAVAQATPGVVAVHVSELRRANAPNPKLVPRLFAELPVASLTGVPLAAELLTLHPSPLALDLLP
jgi:hypothetical protein